MSKKTWVSYKNIKLMFNWLYYHPLARSLSSPQRFILTYLVAKADEQGMSSFPKVSTIARVCGLTENAVRKNLRYLEQIKFIVKSGTKKSKSGRGSINVWSVNFKLIELYDETRLPIPELGNRVTVTELSQSELGNPSEVTELSQSGIGTQKSRKEKEQKETKEQGRTPRPSRGGDSARAKLAGYSPSKRKQATQQLCEIIFGFYPRKVARPKALEAICSCAARMVREQKITFKVAYQQLLVRTKLFAEACASCPQDRKRFIPGPIRWFDEDRWSDDEAEWTRCLKPEHKRGLVPDGDFKHGNGGWRIDYDENESEANNGNKS